MNEMGKRYPEGHWMRSDDPECALRAYMDQQSKAYSRTKNDFVRDLLGDLQGKRFLDYGCGAGMFTVYAAKSDALEVVGVDAEEAALRTARYFAEQEQVGHLCRFISSELLPKASRPRFDVILMKDVIEHVPDDEELLQAARRLLVPGGRLVVSTQNALSMNFLIQGTYQRLLRGNSSWFGWDPTHLRFYTPMSLDRKLRQAGFKSTNWRSVYLVPYKFPGRHISDREFVRIDSLSWIDRTLGGVFPYNRLGWNVIVRANASPLVSQRRPLTTVIREEVGASPLLATRQAIRFQ
jgi:2-polyprenyl-6-hydroxyphenyl methylase / 3-demethylubiquinone-9 3-methyltransferase